MHAIIQVWSAPSCQSGAVCFGALAPWISAQGSEATGTAPSFRVTVPRAVAVDASIEDGRCLRVVSMARGEQWWFVTSVSESDGDAALVQITAAPLRQLLTVRGLVRSGSTYRFTPGRMTPAALRDAYVLTNLATDGLSWLSAGTSDFADVVDIGEIDRLTRAAVLDALEQATGGTVVLRPVLSSGVLTGFAIDLVADVAAGLETVPLAVGANVSTVSRTREATRAATVAVPFDRNGSPLQQTVWLVDSITGSGPAWVALRDPVSGNPWPVREDDQLNGAWLEQRDGTRTAIVDSRASDSAVQIASVGTIAVGDELTVVADSVGTAFTELSSPTGVASARGRLVGIVAAPTADARRNIVRNGALRLWTSPTQPTYWPTSTGIARYSRTETTGPTITLQVDGAVAAGHSALPFRGATPGQRFYLYERLEVVGVVSGFSFSDVVVEADSNGKGSFTGLSYNAAAYADGATLLVGVGPGTTVANNTAIPLRPSSFPDDPIASSLARLVNGNWLDSSTLQVVVGSTPVRVNCAVGLTLTRNAATTDANTWPKLELRSTAGGFFGTTLATASIGSLPTTNSVSHQTVTLSHVLNATATVYARVTPGNITSGGYHQFKAVRWLSLWLGDSDPTMTMQDGSGSNVLWHRAQSVLQGEGAGTRYTVRGVDLARLQSESGALQLGQRVRLRSELLGVDATVRIVKLDYDFAQTETLNLELGVIAPRLSAVTVSL